MNNYQTLEIAFDYPFLLRVAGEKERLSDATYQQVERVWEEEQNARSAPLFNGEVLSLIHFDRSQALVEFVDYKLFLAFVRVPGLRGELNIKPLSLSCLTCTSATVLFGRRDKSVTQYPLSYELAPSGGIDAGAAKGDSVDVVAQAMLELQEETGLKRTDVVKATPFAIVFDNMTGIYEVCVEITINESKDRELIEATPEYDELTWIAHQELPGFVQKHTSRLVPLSSHLLKLRNLI